MADTPETSIVSVDGTKLTLDTIGLGLAGGGYGLADALDPTLPFTISMRPLSDVKKGAYSSYPPTSARPSSAVSQT